MEKELLKPSRSCRFHLCRSDGSECEWKCAAVHNYLHVDAFTRLKEQQANKKVALWKSNKKKTFDIFDAMSVESEVSPSEVRGAPPAKRKDS